MWGMEGNIHKQGLNFYYIYVCGTYSVSASLGVPAKRVSREPEHLKKVLGAYHPEIVRGVFWGVDSKKIA